MSPVRPDRRRGGLVRSVLASALLLGMAGGFLVAQNPLGRPKGAEHPFAGSFEGKDIALELSYEGVKSTYTGWLTHEGSRYSCVAEPAGAGRIKGTFWVTGDSYEFIASLDKDAMTLASGGTEYALRRKAVLPPPPSHPGGQDPPQPSERGGVGIAIRHTENDEFRIEQVVPGGAAARARLATGGLIRAVDGKDVAGRSLEQVIEMISGPVGTLVTITIETEKEVMDAILERAPLAQPPSGPGHGQSPGRGVPPGQGPIPGGLGDPGREPGAAGPGAAGFPAWMKPGARATFYLGSASIAGVNTVLVQDDQGNWVNQQTGQKFAEADNPSTAGSGYLELNIVSVAPDAVLVDSRNYILIDPQAGNTTLTSVTSIVSSGDAIADFWMHPAKLAGMRPVNEGGFRILRGPYNLGERTFDSVSIQSTTAQGYSRTTYDVETGLAIAASSSSVGAAVLTPNPNGTSTTGAGATMITALRLLNVRQLDLPWASSRAPRWLEAGRNIEWTGSQTTAIPGASEVSFPLRMVFTTERLANGCAIGSFRTVLETGFGSQDGGAVPRVSGPGMIGCLWLDPSVAAKLSPNQVIDEDPITRVRTYFAGTENGLSVLVHQSPLEVMRFGYDTQSGVLAAYRAEQKSGVALIVNDVRLVGGR